MQTIFKKDTSGKIRYIKTWTAGPILYQESGVLGTDKPILHEKVCKAKNVGRANQTTPADQAISEMESLIAEKLKGEYFNTLAKAEGGAVILPMLAKSYKDEAKKVDWTDAYAQPKLDGMRALYKNGVFTSREGTIIDTVPHLVEALKDVTLHLDGEIYAHGLSFQENMRLIKKIRPESTAVDFHVYDIVSDEPYWKRQQILEQFCLSRPYPNLNIVLVPTYKVTSVEKLKDLHAKFIGQGYEGSILRWGSVPYKPNGRSSNLLKYKDFLDLALEIKDIEPANQRPEWAVPVFDYNGKEFRAGMKFSHAEREEILRNKQNYIGKVAELRFFEWTEDEIPRFPVMVGIRLDKTKGDK